MAVSAAEFDHLLKTHLRLSGILYPHFDHAASIAKWQAQFTPSQQRRGLEAALADAAEDAFHMAPDRVREIDGILHAEGLTTLSEIQVRHGRRIRRLLKKPRLTREDDAIALKGFLDAGLLNDEDAHTAERLIEGFGG